MSNKKGKKVYGVKVILDFPNYFNLNTYVLNFLTEKKNYIEAACVVYAFGSPNDGVEHDYRCQNCD